MIEVFEKWFSQFTKPEQERLLRHIRKNHIDSRDAASSSLEEKESAYYSSMSAASIKKSVALNEQSK